MKVFDVDALFIAHCNFGTEEIAIRVARALNIPVLLWGERDPRPVPGKPRMLDTQCGLFAASKGLARINAPFSYIVNCYLDEARFTRGYLDFLSAAAVVQAFRKKLRILQIGSRPRQFFSVMYNENELLNKFNIDVVPQPFHEVQKRMNERVEKDSAGFREHCQELTSRIDFSQMEALNVKKTAALVDVLAELALENQCYAIANECWTLYLPVMGFRPCFVNGELSARGLPVACETDVLGAVSSVLLQAAGLGESITFVPEFTSRHPDNENAELLWHCGPFPYLLKDPAVKGFVNEAGKGQWRIKSGDITLCRFDGAGNDYRLLVGEGCGCPGPDTESTFVWFETSNWERWEEKFIFGPYIHHLSGAYGKFGRVMAEAVKYMPGITLDAMENYPLSLGKEE
jgi:L-fucose isomerase-like protein